MVSCCATPSIGAISLVRSELGGRLHQRLPRVVRLARGVGGLVLVVGDELGKRFELLAADFVERRLGLDQLTLVRGALRLRLLQFFLRVVEVDLGADLEANRLLAGLHAIMQGDHQIVFERDAHVEALAGRLLLRELLVEIGKLVVERIEVGGKHGALTKPRLLAGVAVETDFLVGIGDRLIDRCAFEAARRVASDGLLLQRPGDTHRVGAACDLRRVLVVRAARRIRVCSGLRGIEFEQYIAGFDMLAVGDVDRRNLAAVERLDHLGAARRLDLARRDGVNVEPTDERPGQRRRKERADRQHQRHRRGGGRASPGFRAPRAGIRGRVP